MNLAPYTGHRAPRRLARPGPHPLDQLDYRLRAWTEDDSGLMVDAAEAIVDLRKQLAAADARVKGLEADLIVSNANAARLGTKVRLMVAATEPQVWAENSRNRNRILEIAMNDTAEGSKV